MTFIEAFLLGIVEGISEFLPISSTGHLLLAEQLLQIPITDAVKSFDIIIQLGAITAAIVIYAKTLLTNKKIILLVLASFVPTAIIGALLHGTVKAYLLDPSIVAWSLFIGGFIIIGFEYLYKEKTTSIDAVEHMSYGKAVLIGIIQTLAIIPGTSRSAATILGGMILGIKRKTIVDFSFLLAIPTMAGATALDLYKSAHTFTAHEGLTIGIGFITSFIAAYFAIHWLLRYVRTHSFIAFGVYRIVVAVIFWMFVL